MNETAILGVPVPGPPREADMREAAARLRRDERPVPSIRLVIESPRYRDKAPDGREVPTRALPDELLFAARREYTALLDLLERFQADHEGTGLGDEAKALLAFHGRPRARGNWGERFYDPPEGAPVPEGWR